MTDSVRHDPPYELAGKRVWVAGHTGLVGGAITRRLAEEDCEVVTMSHADLDLRRQAEVETWVARARPDAAIVAAATVGGILANRTRPGEFIYDNLMIEANIVETARRNRLERLLFLGSACIYPRDARQPMAEDALLTGPLEPTNQWYAIAKIAGIKMCQAYRAQYGCDFITAQPNNLYGPGDNFDLESSHVIPALMAKAHAAKQAGAHTMEVWGSGTPRREFLYVDDLADAAVFLMRHYGGDAPINIGTGEELTIAELAQTVARVVGFKGSLEFDRTKPDGAPRKLLDVSLMQSLGWRASTPLAEGLAATYAWYLDHVA